MSKGGPKEPTVLVILGNQLFPMRFLPDMEDVQVFMAEDYELCTYYKFHKHKIMLFLAAMRTYADELKDAGYKVHYHSIPEDSNPRQSYEKKLEAFVKSTKATQIAVFEIEDKFMEGRIQALAKSLKIPLKVLQSPMFLTTREQFKAYLKRSKKPFMKTFYEQRRRELKILMNPDGTPEGGKFSFDEDNRARLPPDVDVPKLPSIKASAHVQAVGKLATKYFGDHPGAVADFWLPVSHNESSQWLDDFLEKRFNDFGVYEDAITSRDVALFHSVLSPMMNLGVLTPDEVVTRTIRFAKKRKIPLNSLEGFLRQVIGWRE